MRHLGNLEITKDNEDKFKDLKEVTGNLLVDGSAKLDAPKLETVGGYLLVDGSAKLDALETVGGYLLVDGSAKLDALETVGGNLLVDGSAKLDALETVGGYLRVDGSAKLDAPKDVKYNDTKARTKCVKALEMSFKKKKLIKVDGILSWLVSKKTIGVIVAMKVKIVGKLDFSFVVKKGDVYSHGKTVKEAKESLKYKLTSRDTSEFKKWTLKTTVTQAKMIQAYRAITGACEYGVRNFCEGKKMPAKITLAAAIKLTKGQYGADQFKAFFTASG